jgi:membrane protein implicated in regulation of membrane protease activity
MKFNVYTCYVSWAILAITALYTLIYSGLTGVLFTGAVGLVVAAFMDSVELIVAITVVFALLYTIVFKRLLARIEPFQDSPQKVIQRIASVQKKERRNEPTGVYDASVEGFEDIQPQVPKEGAASDSSSASAQRANQVDPKQVSDVTSATPPASASAALPCTPRWEGHTGAERMLGGGGGSSSARQRHSPDLLAGQPAMAGISRPPHLKVLHAAGHISSRPAEPARPAAAVL